MVTCLAQPFPRVRLSYTDDGELIGECPVCGAQTKVSRTKSGGVQLFCYTCKTQLITRTRKGTELLRRALPSPDEERS